MALLAQQTARAGQAAATGDAGVGEVAEAEAVALQELMVQLQVQV
jgi:hypothetical protein